MLQFSEVEVRDIGLGLTVSTIVGTLGMDLVQLTKESRRRLSSRWILGVMTKRRIGSVENMGVGSSMISIGFE